MDRRAFVAVAAAGGLIAMPAVARAQKPTKVYRIGFISLRSGPIAQDEAFRQTLRELGYAEGRDIIIEYRWATGKEERLPELSAELVRLKVDVIVAAGTVVIAAAKRATSTIPIVMAAAADPVSSGFEPRCSSTREPRHSSSTRCGPQHSSWACTSSSRR